MTDLRLVALDASRVGTIVLVGPGRDNLLDICLAAAPDRLILVEADVQAMPALSRRLADNVSGSTPKLQVLQTALIAASEKDVVHLHLAGSGPFASLCAPTPDLLNRFPGLRDEAPVPVAAMTPATLRALIDPACGPAPSCPDPDCEDILILQSPGQAAALLEAFAAAGLLHRHAQIYLSEPDGAYYAEAGTLDDARTFLSKVGYTCELLEARTRAGWPWLMATLDAEGQSALRKRAQDAKEALREKDAETERLRLSEAEKATQIDALLKSARDAEEALRRKDAETEELRKTLKTKDARIAQLSQVENQTRRSTEEIRKAEGQIALIRDLILRNDML